MRAGEARQDLRYRRNQGAEPVRRTAGQQQTNHRAAGHVAAPASPDSPTHPHHAGRGWRRRCDVVFAEWRPIVRACVRGVQTAHQLIPARSIRLKISALSHTVCCGRQGAARRFRVAPGWGERASQSPASPGGCQRAPTSYIAHRAKLGERAQIAPPAAFLPWLPLLQRAPPHPPLRFGARSKTLEAEIRSDGLD